MSLDLRNLLDLADAWIAKYPGRRLIHAELSARPCEAERLLLRYLAARGVEVIDVSLRHDRRVTAPGGDA